MIRPDFGKWGQDAEAIRRLGVEAEHSRSRERFQALYMIGIGQTNASQWAEKIGRNPRTIMEWVHTYNAKGATAIHYQHSGGCPPFLPRTGQTDS
jgi:hypothetical protein